jgi:hypothetical protein
MEIYKLCCTVLVTFIIVANLLNIPIEIKQINPNRKAFYIKK